MQGADGVMLATRWRRNQNESVYTYFSLPYGKMGLKQKGQIKLVGIEILPWSGNNVRTLAFCNTAGRLRAGQCPRSERPWKRDGEALGGRPCGIVENEREREREREKGWTEVLALATGVGSFRRLEG